MRSGKLDEELPLIDWHDEEIMLGTFSDSDPDSPADYPMSYSLGPFFAFDWQPAVMQYMPAAVAACWDGYKGPC